MWTWLMLKFSRNTVCRWSTRDPHWIYHWMYTLDPYRSHVRDEPSNEIIGIIHFSQRLFVCFQTLRLIANRNLRCCHWAVISRPSVPSKTKYEVHVMRFTLWGSCYEVHTVRFILWTSYPIVSAPIWNGFSLIGWFAHRPSSSLSQGLS